MKMLKRTDSGNIEVNTWVAVITLIILLLSSITTIIAMSTEARADIGVNSKSIVEIKDNQKLILVHIQDLDKRQTIDETNYKYIRESLERIEKKVGD